jgi:coenzyme F420-dependent glucose-6-phosphate dehydrogenase
MELRLGYKASAEQFGPRELLEVSVEAEEHGFDSVVVSDHYQPWRHNGGHAPFSFAWLAALGERTSRVTIGTSVVTPTFRYHPSIVAQALATVGCMYPGRVMLGVGTGESMNEVPPLGIEWPEPPERFQRLKEAIQLIQQLWREDFVTFDGNFYQTRSATVYDRPKDPVPIYVAGSGPAASRLAGRMGDGFICTSGKDPQLYTNVLLPAVAEGLEKEGRPEGEVEKMIEMKVSFDVDKQKALEDTRIWAALALPPEAKTGVEDPREMERLADELPLEKAASRWLVSDDPEEHVEQIRPYVDMGFTHLVFHAPGDDQSRFIETYGEKILPLLRNEFG